MDINAVNANTMGATATQTTDKTNLDYQSFLKIFIEGLKNQDPMAPMEQSEMMGQLAQLTQMENNMKMVSIVESLGNTLMGSKMAQYASYIGKDVSVATNGGDPLTGKVTSIMNDGGVIKATLDGKSWFEVERIQSISSEGV